MRIESVVSRRNSSIKSDGSMALNDVTELLRAAAASLPYGEKLKSPEYAISESMNALELMDPKLDPGVAAALTPIAERLATKALPLHDLTPKAVVLVMDKLLQLEVSLAPVAAAANLLYMTA